MMEAAASIPLQRTPLYDVHVRAGAKMVPFGGWAMPVQYTGIVEEHRAVRGAVGLFDISHMGEFELEGPDALAIVQRLCTNDAATLEVGQVQYTLLCTPDGGIVDDLTLYRLGDDHFMLTVNAANIDKDWRWVTSHGAGRARWRNVSVDTALLAVQGPRAEALVQRLADTDVIRVPYYRFTRGKLGRAPGLLSRTGYTGEDGFELYIPAAEAEGLWQALTEAGRDQGLMPVGLGARDTLRLEMKFALYGNDIDDTTNPLEAGLGWVVKPAKGEFIGRPAIETLRARGPTRKLTGFEMAERAVARRGYRVLKDGDPIGIVTSGSFGPSVERCIGMAYVPTALAGIGSEFEVEIRGAGHRARVVPTPFHPSRVKKS